MGRVVCWMYAFLSPTTHSCSDNLRKLASAQRASQSMLCHIAGQCPMHFRTLILQSALLGRKNKYALVSKYGVLNRELFLSPVRPRHHPHRANQYLFTSASSTVLSLRSPSPIPSTCYSSRQFKQRASILLRALVSCNGLRSLIETIARKTTGPRLYSNTIFCELRQSLGLPEPHRSPCASHADA
jgi:hypothetical protein